VFPTNDFGKYYLSAIDEKGLFNPALGDTALLFNTQHPDPKDPLHKYGVDDGFGYLNKDGRSYKFIGYYTWKYWAMLYNGLGTLADAYLYTGEQIYAHKAAILLDRIADVYPTMDWEIYGKRGWLHSDGGRLKGKIEGTIWETNVARNFADAYDKIISGTINDTALYSFLISKAQTYKLPGPKGSRQHFIDNVDENILRCALKAVLEGKIVGNEGMHQRTVATAAIALNNSEETSKWLDWIFEENGGALPQLMSTQFDHDGSTHEGAPSYSVFLGLNITDIATLIKDYSKYDKHDIFKDFPQLKATFTLAYRLAALGIAIPNIGDSGATGLVAKKEVNPRFMAKGFKYTLDPAIAIAAYRANGNKAEGLGRDIYAKNPDSLTQVFKELGEKAGSRPIKGYQMSGFGLSLLEAKNNSSTIALVGSYGRTIKHGHPDLLNFDLLAFGNWLTPDLGYPEFATDWPHNKEWSGSTLSHNTVLVDQKPQKEIWSGETKFFKQLQDFGAFEIDGKRAYPHLKTYTRTMLLIGGDNEIANNNAYIIDIFRIAGGNDHLYSFHGPPGTTAANNLNLQAQSTGTYAGPNIAKGTVSEKKFPIGYSHLYNVKKDTNPPSNFTIDWNVDEGYRNIKKADNIHLRLHSLNQSTDVALADGDPPKNKPGNPTKLEYALFHRKGKDLNSTFVSLLEPYQHQPFLKSVIRLDDGNGPGVSLKVEKENGGIDYILYNPSLRETKFSDSVSMLGNIAHIQTINGVVKKVVLVNGKALTFGKLKLVSPGPFTGKILKMNKEQIGSGWVIVNALLPTDGSLNGQQLIIVPTGDRDASYTIKQIVREGQFSKIICEEPTFVRGLDANKKSLYEFKEGANFSITSHLVWTADKN
jgi:hypothetical protein